VNPSRAVTDAFERRIGDRQTLSFQPAALRDLPAQTPDGVAMPLYANLGSASDIDAVRQSAAEAVGPFRTEYRFLLREAFPIEEVQYEFYRDIPSAFAPKPVPIRTLDVGGDKILSNLLVVEKNPFLGCRGIRFSLAHPEIFLIRLRAVLRDLAHRKRSWSLAARESAEFSQERHADVRPIQTETRRSTVSPERGDGPISYESLDSLCERR
jgi:phosphotransferase system enzyme I (PtsP)